MLMSDESYYPGLEGVIAGETAIATVEGGLLYRGYPIEQLASEATFLEVAYLLLHCEFPNQEVLADFQSILAESAEVDPTIMRLLADIPLNVGGMDVLRTGISALAHFDPQLQDDDRNANIAKTVRLLARIPILIAARYRQSQGLPLVESNSELSFAANLLHLITAKEPSALQERAMEVSLILYAEHEFNASTFTARVVTSTGSDLYSAITAAVGALKGPLHGGANERVIQVLREVGSAKNAEPWVREALSQKRRIMGFGHRVYKTGDPRATILRKYCIQLAAETGETELEEIADTIETVVRQEKGLPPNLDWPSARLYHYLGIAVELYTPLFVASRVLGWAAHVIEQSENNRLIRPRSRYTGPPRREFTPLSERG
jgi:citrate synthase